MKSKPKKLKTEQMMRVQIGSFGTIEIGHKTEMGQVSQVMEMGNRLRQIKGLSTIPLEEILRRPGFWEFVIALDTQKFEYTEQMVKSGNIPDFKNILNLDGMNSENETIIYSNFSELAKYKDKDGRIQYTELMKKFPHLIKSKRGRNGGTWAHLYLLLKIASMLDKDLEVKIYQVFIEEKILYFRDEGGYSFKELNKAIDKYLPSPTGNNTGRYITIAKIIREKLEITDTKGYNEKEHHAKIQEKRDKIENNLIFALQTGLITSFEQLQEVAEKMEI